MLILAYMKYDIAVIGAGPAGLMSAIRASELGARVIVIEKNRQAGIKLLLTGGGRCNFTNQLDDNRKLAQAYGASGKFLLSALAKFGPASVIEFFDSLGVASKTEANGRVFPQSDKAQDILDALLKYAVKSGVEIRTLAEVREIAIEGDKITKLVLSGNDEIIADKFILATGGKSYFKTGSNGDGYKWLKSLGHKLGDSYPALTPIFVCEKYIAELQGLSLLNVKIAIYSAGKKIISKSGDMLFTAKSLSGPLALDLSRAVARELPKKVIVKIDLIPDIDIADLEKNIIKHFSDTSNKAVKNSLGKFLPPKLVPIILRLAKIDPDKKVNSIAKDERKRLVGLMKEFNFEIDSLGGYDFAMITSGGINLAEVDQKTMRSKLVSNLYLAGEILGLDGPTGGYNLQVCWSSGYVAGESAVNNS